MTPREALTFLYSRVNLDILDNAERIVVLSAFSVLEKFISDAEELQQETEHLCDAVVESVHP